MTRTFGPTCALIVLALAGCSAGPGESLEEGDWVGDPSDPGDSALWPRLEEDTSDPALQSIDPFEGLVSSDPPPELPDPIDDPSVLDPAIVPLLDPPGTAATCSAPPPSARPASCPFGRNEVVIWSARGWSTVARELETNRSECTESWVSIPPVIEQTTVSGIDHPVPYKLTPRGDDAARIRALGPHVHAMAEFHWASWATYRKKTSATWREIGHEFRRRMELAGYCVASGDTWGIDEAPTMIRNDPAARIGWENLIRGLTEGAPGMRAVRGAVFVWGMGHRTTNFDVYKPSVKSWLQDSHFWAQMNVGVRWWGQEVYADPMRTCVGGVPLSQHADHIDEFSMHVADLAFAARGRSGTGNARAYLGRAYTPVLNAVYGAQPMNGYGTTTIPVVQMQHFLTEEVYATRAFADTHPYADGRIGFGFGSYGEPNHWAETAHVMAQAIEGAYGPGGTAQDACGDGSWCRCNVPGAAYHSGWATFQRW